MRKDLVGQTSEQKRNCEEQKRRRASIAERFPKTLTFHTYEDIAERIAKRETKIAKAFEIAGEKIRLSEVKSLAIAYYVYAYRSKKKMRLFEAIYRKASKEDMTLDKLLKLSP